MLELQVYDGDKPVMLRFEHSLLSLSKWEARNQVPFLSKAPKSATKMVEYFQDMLVEDVDDTLVYVLSPEQLEQVTKYIYDKQTASSVPDIPSKGEGTVVTSELIYYWLSALQIPFTPTETWHVNRVMMLVQIANFHQQDPNKNKRSDKEIMTDWAAENERRKALFNTTG